MDFVCFTLPKDAFPRFDNACTKSSGLHTRYSLLLGKPKPADLRVNKYVKLYLCRQRNETDFPVEINSCIAETVQNGKLKPGAILQSRNIYSFLNSQEETDLTISLMIVDIKAKKEIMKLGKNKFHFIVAVEDDHVKTELEKELKANDKSITVANKGNVANEIDNLLERISLAPLKLICENCYDLLKHKDAAENSTGFPDMEFVTIQQAGNKERKLRNRKEMIAETSINQPNGFHHMHSSDQYRPGYRHTGIKTENKPDLTSGHMSFRRQNGFEHSLEEKTEKVNKYINKHEESKVNTSAPDSTSIYTRIRSQHGERILNGSKDTITSTKISKRKEIKGLVRQRSEVIDTVTTSKGKRRKTVLSDKIGLSDTEYQSPSTGHIKVEESTERLIEAILALYGMSNVPETEKPNVPKQSYKVSKEMRNELFQISPTIKRMGYRYRTFYIYAVKPKCQADEEMRKKQISLVLKRYGIHNFEIAPCAERVTELMHVGAKIEVRPGACYSLRTKTACGSNTVKGGTLGCFANMNDGKEQCGLLSKHVSEDCRDVYYVGEGNNAMIGHMVEATNEHQPEGLDISAALLNEHVGEDGKKFRDTRRTLLRGKLHKYNEEEDEICRSGQPVHIYGAVSDPGKGEITMPCVDSGLSTTLIQVEDEICGDGTEQKPFAVKGDSGAIVCVEDPNRKNIHALSMVIGTPDSKYTKRRTYLTLPLSKGLQQLEDNTGKTFTLS
ncbi:uncharacterized protein LOC123533893 [Mercenaria mercenaria]|uniref:uncharacterized protein LOC123533893 n=1 Tax=Mercenaria mercenaria TaxID=6596 RepID=UPI00234F01E4|nr:uncharacterized protein LOC123533893 [Mercenaria mercenaria]